MSMKSGINLSTKQKKRTPTIRQKTPRLPGISLRLRHFIPQRRQKRTRRSQPIQRHKKTGFYLVQKIPPKRAVRFAHEKTNRAASRSRQLRQKIYSSVITTGTSSLRISQRPLGRARYCQSTQKRGRVFEFSKREPHSARHEDDFKAPASAGAWLNS